MYIGFDGYIPNEELLTEAIRGLMVGILGFTHPLGPSLFQKATYPTDTTPQLLIEPSEVVIQATCNAFARYIISLYIFEK